MTPVSHQRAGFSTHRLARVDRLLERYVDNGLLAGALGLIYRQGEIAYNGSFGQRDLETGQPMTEDTIFRIFSMTKPITAVAALMLFEDGHFLLDDPVADYMPEFSGVGVFTGDLDKLEEPARPLNVKDLFMHTAGFSYGWGQDSPVEEMYRKSLGNRERFPMADLVRKMGNLPLLFHPGSRWQYSLATDVLGHLVELLSGSSLDTFFQREIFAPLGMVGTGFHVPPEQINRFAACYCPVGGFSFGRDLGRNSRSGSRFPGETGTAAGARIELYDSAAESRFAREPVSLSGGGGLVSTATDYLRFSQMLLNGGVLDGNRLLGRKTVEMMRANHLPKTLLPISIAGAPDAGYGFGLGVSVLVDPSASNMLGSPGSYGWGGAATTQFWIDPEEEMLGILMTQFAPAGYYPIARQFRLAAYQALIA